jgi:hypothetical protein
LKAAKEESRKIAKAEAKKDAMRLAIRRQADEILAKDEYQRKLADAAHKYNLIQIRSKTNVADSDSDSDDN